MRTILSQSQLLILPVALLLPIGCQSTSGLSRLETLLQPAGSRDLAGQWDDWGRRNLQDGDVVFILGTSRVFLGLVNFSKFSSEIADSRFSHVGIIAIEDGQPYVYDTVSGGPRRKPLGWFLARSQIRRVAFRRPREDLESRLPHVLHFCRQVYSEHVPYDEQFLLNDDRLYCSEFVEEAFRQQDISLCDAVRIDSLPNFDAFPAAMSAMIETTTSISREQAVIFPGNESYGIWSSPMLTLLLPEQSPNQVPHDLSSHRSTDGER